MKSPRLNDRFFASLRMTAFDVGLEFGSLEFRYCFGFSASDFEIFIHAVSAVKNELIVKKSNPEFTLIR